jgi:hypothetical protein
MHTVLAKQHKPIRASARIARRLAKAAQRHNPTHAHSKQSSQHDTIETALTVRVPSAQRYSSSRVYGSRRAANHKQARFQARSIITSLEQLHMHSETSSNMHAIHMMLAQQHKPRCALAKIARRQRKRQTTQARTNTLHKEVKV